MCKSDPFNHCGLLGTSQTLRQLLSQYVLLATYNCQKRHRNQSPSIFQKQGEVDMHIDALFQWLGICQWSRGLKSHWDFHLPGSNAVTYPEYVSSIGTHKTTWGGISTWVVSLSPRSLPLLLRCRSALYCKLYSYTDFILKNCLRVIMPVAAYQYVPISGGDL